MQRTEREKKKEIDRLIEQKRKERLNDDLFESIEELRKAIAELGATLKLWAEQKELKKNRHR